MPQKIPFRDTAVAKDRRDASRPNGSGSHVLVRAPISAIVLWVCLWMNLNSGFWDMQSPTTKSEWLLLIRAILPFAVLPLAAILLLGWKRLRRSWRDPSVLLFGYGILSTLAAVASPNPSQSLYWAVAFLASILAAWTFVDPADSSGSSRQLLHLTWIATFIVAMLIARQASHAIFGHLQTGYGAVTKELEEQSRSSGVARWAAVPGLVSLLRAYHCRRPLLIAIYLSCASVAFFIVYRMQSRGAVFGVMAALAFALIMASRMRRYALPFALLAIVAMLFAYSPATVSNHITAYLERGQSREEFLSMTGRTRAYRKGIAAFEDAPIVGRGQWADRLVFQEHIHNSYLQALLNAGILGGIPYFASWCFGWILFFHLHRRSRLLYEKDRLALLEAGTVMMFFTARSIPETTTASYSVDLLVMISVYVYLESLAIHVSSSSRVHYVFDPSQVQLRMPLNLRGNGLQHHL